MLVRRVVDGVSQTLAAGVWLRGSTKVWRVSKNMTGVEIFGETYDSMKF